MKVLIVSFITLIMSMTSVHTENLNNTNNYYYWPEDYQQFPDEIKNAERSSAPQYITLMDICCMNRVDFKERIFLIYFCPDLIYEIDITLETGEVRTIYLEDGIPNCPPTVWDKGLVWNIYYSEPLNFNGYKVSRNTCTMIVTGNEITTNINNGHCKYELKEYEHYFSFANPTPLNIIQYKATVCYSKDNTNHYCFNDPEVGYLETDVTD